MPDGVTISLDSRMARQQGTYSTQPLMAQAKAVYVIWFIDGVRDVFQLENSIDNWTKGCKHCLEVSPIPDQCFVITAQGCLATTSMVTDPEWMIHLAYPAAARARAQF